MGGFGIAVLSTSYHLSVDIERLCDILRKMGVANAPASLGRWRYTPESLNRLHQIAMHGTAMRDVWEMLLEIGDSVTMLSEHNIDLNDTASLVQFEYCWHLSFPCFPFGDRLVSEWNAVPEAIRGKTNACGSSLTVGPHVQAFIRPDQSDFASVRVLEASFSLHFSGYPYKTAEVFEAMKSLPTLQRVRECLEPVLGPLDVDATWSF